MSVEISVGDSVRFRVRYRCNQSHARIVRIDGEDVQLYSRLTKKTFLIKRKDITRNYSG